MAERHYPMQSINYTELRQYFGLLLKPDRQFYLLAVIYTIAISLLTLAVPISVQTLISTVANSALIQPVVTLSILLCVLLILSGLIYALRTYVMELFRRRIYCRLTSEIVLRTIYSKNTYFEERDRRSLFNRYFDIMTLQKSIPSLLVGGFSLFLQAIVGFTVVSLYHPVFLMFNLGFLTAIFLIWRVWGPRAVQTGIELSHSKYNMADWLEKLGDNAGFFRARRHIDFALERTEDATAGYMRAHKRHFRKHFAQTISLLLLYALASSALLGLGGWLVILGELTLGQLVAAELIMTAIFFGVSQSGVYLDTFYDLCAGIEELSMFLQIPQEENSADQPIGSSPHNITFRQIRHELLKQKVDLNLHLPAGYSIIADAERLALQQYFINLLKRHEPPLTGQILIGDQDITEVDSHDLRQAVIVLDRPTLIECSIADYLQLANPSATRLEQHHMLQLVGIDQVVDGLEAGWHTLLHANGAPLSLTETLRLRIAAALLARPSVLITTQVFDVIEAEIIQRVIKHINQQDVPMTFIAFSRHQSVPGWTANLELGFEQQTLQLLNGDHNDS